MSEKNVSSVTYLCDNRFELFWDKILGKGATSVVYEGIEISSGHLVAIKIVDKGYKMKVKKSISEMIMNELEILKIVNNNPFFIKLIDSFEDEKNFFLIFEKANNNFDNFMKTIDNKDIFMYLKQLLNCMIFLKNNTIIHNDSYYARGNGLFS